MTAVAEFANGSLADVRPGMLSASDADASRLSSLTAAPVLCTPVAVIEVTVATVELSMEINRAVNENG
jgi:hypothetical protein